MMHGRPLGPQPPRHETSCGQAGCAYAQLARDLANWSLFEGGTTPEVLETSAHSSAAAETVAGDRHHVSSSAVAGERLQGQSVLEDEPAERRESVDHR